MSKLGYDKILGQIRSTYPDLIVEEQLENHPVQTHDDISLTVRNQGRIVVRGEEARIPFWRRYAVTRGTFSEVRAAKLGTLKNVRRTLGEIGIHGEQSFPEEPSVEDPYDWKRANLTYFFPVGKRTVKDIIGEEGEKTPSDRELSDVVTITLARR